jgi:hypothetical protein
MCLCKKDDKFSGVGSQSELRTAQCLPSEAGVGFAILREGRNSGERFWLCIFCQLFFSPTIGYTPGLHGQATAQSPQEINQSGNI